MPYPLQGHENIRKQDSKSTTVVICTRNRPALLRRCLEAIDRLDTAPDRVLIVDNSEGNHETRAVACEYHADYLIEPKPGLSRARNRGLAESDTDIVAFLDDDVIPEPSWLRLLLSPFSDDQIGAATGRVVTPASITPSPDQLVPRSLGNNEHHWFEIATFGGLGLGANMAFVKRACFERNFFDERLGRGAPFEIGEESYAFASLLSRGYRVAYIPTAIVYHPPITRSSVAHEAQNSFSYWLLLFSAFPGQRLDLLRFLARRLRRIPLDWPRNPQEAGEIISSSWQLKMKAAWRGFVCFLRTPKPQ